ncbi:DUF4198 domain-containing protein [uncultured Desulfosarcina sp.]|uniref:DUF4198 domain-containing protein n=1 Tax=uncultured Desulfosarcina sp. TaxID=218289 RepID=UPI0029C87625|nr:DUF4198 domain-containing protein [uncultured Desulfosarcina sp.]
MRRQFYIVPLLTLFCLITFSLTVRAHNLWLNPDNYFPRVGTTVDIGIGWGHKYPANRVDQEIKEGRVEAIQAVDPDGTTVDLPTVSTGRYRLKIDKPGAWLITARIKPGFFTTTPEGRKWGDKKSIADPIKCTNFHIQAKTVLIAGGSDKNLTGAAGQPLEVIPLTDLERMKPGDSLAIKVLFDGSPLSDATVRATFAGFEAEDVAPHKPPVKDDSAKHQPPAKGQMHPHKHFPVETETNAQGRADLKIEKAGYWMIMLSHRCPYTDTATCDEYMYNMAFSFEIR